MYCLYYNTIDLKCNDTSFIIHKIFESIILYIVPHDCFFKQIFRAEGLFWLHRYELPLFFLFQTLIIVFYEQDTLSTMMMMAIVSLTKLLLLFATEVMTTTGADCPLLKSLSERIAHVANTKQYTVLSRQSSNTFLWRISISDTHITRFYKNFYKGENNQKLISLLYTNQSSRIYNINLMQRKCIVGCGTVNWRVKLATNLYLALDGKWLPPVATLYT